MAHTEKMEEVFAEIYEKFILETEKTYKHIHVDRYGSHNESENAKNFPFFSSLNEEQKRMYLEVVKRISLDAASIILDIIDHTDGLEMTLDGEKIDVIVEEFMIADGSAMGPNPPPPMF